MKSRACELLLHSAQRSRASSRESLKILESFTTTHPGSSQEVAQRLVTVEIAHLQGHNAEMQATIEGRAVTAVGPSEGGMGMVNRRSPDSRCKRGESQTARVEPPPPAERDLKESLGIGVGNSQM